MINIVSRSIVSKLPSGPQKVVNNLIKGLDIIGYPYCVNKSLNSTSQLWIHDDPTALKVASRLKLKALVGPNIYLMPRNIPPEIDLSNFVYLHPSKWAVDFWRNFGYKSLIDSWPAGIDTQEFGLREKPTDGTVLIYYKQRFVEELDFVKKILENNKIKYDIIRYGSYKQKDYLEKLKQTKYIIWLGRQESQGIALEEALSMNVPILVWDVLTMGHWIPTAKESKIFTRTELDYPATCAAYFDERCGLMTKNKSDIREMISQMENVWSKLEPRRYIVENLSLEKQSREFIKLYEKYYGISFDHGLTEEMKSEKSWRNSTLPYRTYFLIKDLAKKVINSARFS